MLCFPVTDRVCTIDAFHSRRARRRTFASALFERHHAPPLRADVVRGGADDLAVLALFDEPLVGRTLEGKYALPTETLTQMVALAKSALATLESAAPSHPQELTIREMASTAHLTTYAARKVLLSQEIRRGLADPKLTPEQCYGYKRSLQALDVELEDLRMEFERLWLARARRSEIHIALGYYAGLRARYAAAVSWLDAQHQKLLQGQPVDAQLTSYETGGYHVLWRV